MKVIIDMNLSPAWVTVLGEDGQSAVHWSSIGSLSAEDCEILAWAREHQHILFTHDLDFGAILAATYADTPSVIQIRTHDPTPDRCRRIVSDIFRRYADALADGALISVDEDRARVHILPMRKGSR